MAAHPDERAMLLAKERRNYGTEQNLTCNTQDNLNEDDSIERDDPVEEVAGTADSSGEEVTVDYDELEFGLSWRHLNLYLIEPLVLILMFAYNLSSTVLKNQVIYQTCTAIYFYNESDCALLGTKNATNHTKELEKLIQPYAARFFMTSNLLEAIVPAICGIFIGAWSDRFGRKPLLLAAFIGYTSYYIICGSIAFLALKHPISPWYYLLAVVPHTLLGGNVTYTVAAFCFITDVTSSRQRPYRMVFYEAALYIGLMIGSLAAGYIYDATNSSTVFAISAGSLFFSVLIIAIFVPESLNFRLKHVLGENFGSQSSGGGDRQDNNGVHQNKIKKLFDYELLQQMWRTSFKPRPFSDRTVIWLIIASTLITVFILNGSVTVFYLFVREQFDWSVLEFTTYETVSILIAILGNIFGIYLLRKLLRVSLINLTIISLISQSASSLMKGFAAFSWQLYLAVTLGAFRSLSHPMARSIITNMVPANELGKIFSFQSALQAFMPFIASPVYTFVYSITLSSFPGFFNVLSANLFILAIALLLVVLRKKHLYPEHYDAVFNS